MTTLTLCNVSLATVPLPEMFTAAARAGFDAVTVAARPYRYAVEKAGATDTGLAALAADLGIRVTDFEAVGDWLGPEPVDGPRWLRTVVYSTDTMVEIAARLGAETLVAVHAGAPQPVDVAAAAFARLCERAADSGLRVALEYPAWMGIGSLADAWDVVRNADRPNAGLLVDSWHHRRSHSDDALLASIPPERIYSIQLGDAAAEMQGSLIDDVQRRVLPGQGDLDVAGLLRTLRESGVTAPVGIEVLDASLVDDGVEEAARVLYDALCDTVRAADREVD